VVAVRTKQLRRRCRWKSPRQSHVRSTRAVNEYHEFTGHVEAVERVAIRPRVSGFISAVKFDEGQEVRAGDVLFVIDPRPYEAELKRAKAELTCAVTARALAQSERERAEQLLAARAIWREEFDSRLAGSEQADAQVAAAEAAVEAVALNVTCTQVRASILGLVSKAVVTIGNLLTASSTLLTTLVSIDPVYVTFEDDDQQLLRYIAVHDGYQTGRIAEADVLVGLAGEEGTPHASKLVFRNTEVDPRTGTIRARAQLANPQRIFTPDMFARVTLADRQSYSAVLIKDSAIGTDQNLRFVYVRGADNRIEQRALKLGPTLVCESSIRA
jgi:multidrug efflux system membrane fusion protein